ASLRPETVRILVRYPLGELQNLVELRVVRLDHGGLRLRIDERGQEGDAIHAALAERGLHDHRFSAVAPEVIHALWRYALRIHAIPPYVPLEWLFDLHAAGRHEVADAVEAYLSLVDLDGPDAMRVMAQNEVDARIDRGVRDRRLIGADGFGHIVDAPVNR